MDEARLLALIELLRDDRARPDERDDAAIDLGSADDPRAVEALLEAGSRAELNETVLASCGESLAHIAARRGRLDPEWQRRLAPPASQELVTSLRAERPDLVETPGLWPWEREAPDAFRVVVRLTLEEWDVVEDALKGLGSDEAYELLYRIGEQTGSN